MKNFRSHGSWALGQTLSQIVSGGKLFPAFLTYWFSKKNFGLTTWCYNVLNFHFLCTNLVYKKNDLIFKISGERMPINDVIISAFSEEQVERLTGISKTQLRYWDYTNFFKPALADENRRVAFSRIFSFKDVASLRVLNVLRNQYNVPLQHLRQVAKDLLQMSDAKWTATQLFVLNKRVVFVEPNTKQYREIVSKQYVIGIPLHIVVSDTKRDVERLQQRSGDDVGKVTRARNVSHNAWVIAGTRISVATIKRFAEDGYAIEEIQEEYPTLTADDIRAAIDHESDGVAA